MTETRKSEEGDSKSNQSLVLQASKEQHLMGMTIQGHARVRETDKMIAMHKCGMSHRKTWNTDLSSNGTAKWRRPTRSGVRRYRWSHRSPPRAPMEPNAWGDAPPQKRNAHQWRKPSAKTRCKRGDNATGSINETDAKKRLRARSGHS